MSAKRNLPSLLLHLQDSSDGIFFTSNSGKDIYLSYSEILKSARGLLHHLLEKGLRKGDELIFQFNRNENFILTFWACQLGGIVPVPVSTSKTDVVKQKLSAIWKTLQNPWLISDWMDNTITDDDFIHIEEIKESLYQRYISYNEIVENLDKLAEINEIDENSTAFIQFSSGSTGQPKGIVLTHKNLLTNLYSIDAALQPVRNLDFICSWTPLTHDLGIIGGHLVPIYSQVSHNLISTNYYLKNPSIWLQKISQYKATFSTSPNFGFYYSAKHADHKNLQQIDLSSIKSILNGAEPISHEVCEKFIETFHPYGLKNNSILPVYGMAEACLAVTIPELHKPLKVYTIERCTLNQGNEVKITNSNNEPCFVGVGKAVKGCSVKLVDENKGITQDRVIGEILIKGENVTKNYYGHLKGATDKNGWLHTGDLGFLNNDELIITGRKKDIIFSKGQNYYPQDLERLAEQLDEIETSKVVFAGHTSINTGIEEVLGFVNYKGAINDFIPIAEKIKMHVSEKAGISIKHIIAVKKIPKTTSGKVQRYLLIENYRNGIYDNTLAQIESIKDTFQKKNIISGRNDLERQLIAIWEEVLEIEPIGINDNFFELGGDSVKAIRIGTKLQELKYECEPALLLERKTIREISEYIKDSSIIISEKKEIDKIRNFQNEQSEYSITHFSNDDLEEVFSKE